MAEFIFQGELSVLLRPVWRGTNPVDLTIDRAASVKDVIESLGPPHTEVGSILLQGREVDFTFPVLDRHRFAIHPVVSPCDVTRATLLRPHPLTSIRFLVDANVGRLARYLRMAGFDTLYADTISDEEIVQQLERDRRILLSRDIGLLKRKQVEYGRYVRSENPADQLREVLHLYNLTGRVAPFTRCLECNALLQPVAKEQIRERLEPLTDKYYKSFSICKGCDKLYWSGSHIDKMRRDFPELTR